jgi:hypothetical protein
VAREKMNVTTRWKVNRCIAERPKLLIWSKNTYKHLKKKKKKRKEKKKKKRRGRVGAKSKRRGEGERSEQVLSDLSL